MKNRDELVEVDGTDVSSGGWEVERVPTVTVDKGEDWVSVEAVREEGISKDDVAESKGESKEPVIRSSVKDGEKLRKDVPFSMKEVEVKAM